MLTVARGAPSIGQMGGSQPVLQLLLRLGIAYLHTSQRRHPYLVVLAPLLRDLNELHSSGLPN